METLSLIFFHFNEMLFFSHGNAGNKNFKNREMDNGNQKPISFFYSYLSNTAPSHFKPKARAVIPHALK